MTTTITRSQYQQLQSFFFALSCHYLDGVKTNFAHWADLLDDSGIPWSTQNTVSELAQYRDNTGFYLSTLLKRKNIIIK